MITEPKTGKRRLLLLALVAGTLGAAALAGCGEKSEPAVHPPTTAATTTTPPATTTAPAATTATPTSKTPVPKTTP